MTSEEFSKIVRQLRGDMSWYAYGKALGVYGSQIKYWESGELKNVPLGAIYKIKRNVKENPHEVKRFLKAVGEDD